MAQNQGKKIDKSIEYSEMLQSDNETEEFHDVVNNGNEYTVNVNASSPANSYASRLKAKLASPKKEQGLILDYNENLRIGDYIVAVGSIVQPKNVIFASRIAKNRVGMFLTSKLLVDKLTSEPGKIDIKGFDISVRPLIAKQKRLILGNVSPLLPHDIVKEKLIEAGVQLTSEISFLKTGGLPEEYSHVFSYRRQVFVDANSNFPPRLEIKFEETMYNIFVERDILKCYNCKAEGHIARNCSNQNQITQIQDSNTEAGETNPSGKHSEVDELIHLPAKVNSTDLADKAGTVNQSIEHKTPNIITEAGTSANSELFKTPPQITNLTNKRPRSLVSSSDGSSLNEFQEYLVKKQSEKKAKKMQPEKSKNTDSTRLETLTTEPTIKNLAAQLAPAILALESKLDSYPLSIQEFSSFLHSTRGKQTKKITELARLATVDLNKLNQMLNDFYEEIDQPSLKKRLKKIASCLTDDTGCLDSEVSDNSSTADDAETFATLVTRDQIQDEPMC